MPKETLWWWRPVFLQLVLLHEACCSTLCQCQEHHSGFHTSEDALRLNLMSSRCLTWPQQAMGAASHPSLCTPACCGPSPWPYIRCFCCHRSRADRDLWSWTSTASLNHSSSKQWCPDKTNAHQKALKSDLPILIHVAFNIISSLAWQPWGFFSLSCYSCCLLSPEAAACPLAGGSPVSSAAKS